MSSWSLSAKKLLNSAAYLDKSSAKKDLKSLVALSYLWGDITPRSMKHLRKTLNFSCSFSPGNTNIQDGSKIFTHWRTADPNGLFSSNIDNIVITKSWASCLNCFFWEDVIALDRFSLSTTTLTEKPLLILWTRSNFCFVNEIDFLQLSSRFAGFNDFRLHSDFKKMSNDGFQLKE